jgi:hypothetical protein
VGTARHAPDVHWLQAASRPNTRALCSSAARSSSNPAWRSSPLPSGPPSWLAWTAAAATELGEIELGARPGRRERDEITLYEAMGHVIEDIVAADLVYRRAWEQAAGHTVEL